MNVLHIIGNSVRVPDLKKLFAEQFPDDSNTFLIISNKQDDVDFSMAIRGVDRIVIHGMEKYSVKQFKTLIKTEKDIAWVIWGHDLYDAYWDAHSFKWKHPDRYFYALYIEQYRKKLIKRIKYVIAYAGDYEILTKRYSTKAQYIYFNSLQYGVLPLEELKENENSYLKILVGHSPCEQCRFEECFDILKKYDDGKMNIYAPLTYKGQMPAIVKRVSDYGKHLFGERFIPIYTFIPYKEYYNFLNTMDIGIFNHNRQMAGGNIKAMIRYGKKVYVSDENTIKRYVRELGCKVYDICDINEKSIHEPLDELNKQRNKRIILDNMDMKKFHETWDYVFDK